MSTLRHGPPVPIEVRREERELFFDTVERWLRAVRQLILIVILMAFAGYIVVGVFSGHLVGEGLLLRLL